MAFIKYAILLLVTLLALCCDATPPTTTTTPTPPAPPAGNDIGGACSDDAGCEGGDGKYGSVCNTADSNPANHKCECKADANKAAPCIDGNDLMGACTGNTADADCVGGSGGPGTKCINGYCKCEADESKEDAPCLSGSSALVVNVLLVALVNLGLAAVFK